MEGLTFSLSLFEVVGTMLVNVVTELYRSLVQFSLSFAVFYFY